jgi:hypothetical protein
MEFQVLWVASKDGTLIHKNKSIVFAELFHFILRRCDNIDIFDGMWHAMTDSLQTKRKNLQVFCDKWNNDINRFLCRL